MTPPPEVSTLAALRDAVGRWKREGLRVGFVPTMGYLHEGHLSLVRIARRHADRVVVSIFVNPTQFAPGEDLARYPRDLERDRGLLAAIDGGVDLCWVPTVEEMYPHPGRAWVNVESVSEGLDGASRPGHFRGVATVVAKLFHQVLPDVAVFGEKDAQQLAVVRAMVADLDIPVEIVGGPIVREGDGLALSSRNVYLSPEERGHALVLSRSLFAARDRVAAGERDAATLRRAIADAIRTEPAVRLDYAEVVDADSMAPLARLGGTVVMAAAIFVGKTRLIDNVRLELPGESPTTAPPGRE